MIDHRYTVYIEGVKRTLASPDSKLACAFIFLSSCIILNFRVCDELKTG